MSPDSKTVYKLNDFRYADDNLSPFFERIEAHNLLFPDCAYSLIGLNNVLLGVDDEIYFIDTIIYKSKDNNIDVYKSLSPKYS